jgi:Fe-S-cluster-containing dehydrogenase component
VSGTGVWEQTPCEEIVEGIKFREQLFIGMCTLSDFQIASIIAEMKEKYQGNSYHLINRNCNHFTDDLCMRLCGTHIPGFVNRVANIGKVFQPLLGGL